MCTSNIDLLREALEKAAKDLSLKEANLRKAENKIKEKDNELQERDNQW